MTPVTTVGESGATQSTDDEGGGAKEKARQFGGQAAEAGSEVASTAKEKAREVAGEAGYQAREVAAEAGQRARDLVGQAREQARTQANNQRDRVTGSLRSISDELEAMATKGDQSGPATEVARELSERARSFASYLEQREPGDLLNEVRDFARRRPGAFLLGALAAGVVAGRLTRGIAAASGSGGQSGQPAGEWRTETERTYIEPDVSYGQGAVGPYGTSEPVVGAPLTTDRPAADEGAWPTPPPPATDPSRPGTQSW